MINLLAVTSIWPIIIGCVLNLVLGMLWYGPLFGKPWMKYVGMKKEDMQKAQKSATPGYALSLLSALVISYVIEVLINTTGTSTIWGALFIGFMLWFGVQIPAMIKIALFERRPAGLFFINTGFDLVCILIVSIAAFFL